MQNNMNPNNCFPNPQMNNGMQNNFMMNNNMNGFQNNNMMQGMGGNNMMNNMQNNNMMNNMQNNNMMNNGMQNNNMMMGMQNNNMMMMNGMQNNMNMNMNGMNNMQNINMMNPGMMNQGMMNPGMMSPGMMNPGMMSPGMMSPGMMNPAMMNPAMNQGMMVNMIQNVAVLNNAMQVMMNKMQEMNRQAATHNDNNPNSIETNTSGNVKPIENPNNNPEGMIQLICHRANPNDKNKNFKINIFCSPNDKIKTLVEKFCSKSMENKDELMFIYSAQNLAENNKLNRTISSFGILDGAQITIVNKRKMKGGIYYMNN